MKQKFTFAAPVSRRIPDPVFHKSHGISRYILFVPVRAIPGNIPLDPNARVPNLNKRVYKQIEDSLLNKDCEPNTFHLKHKGITLVAEKVESKIEGEFTVTIGDGQGVLDGGHTYALITGLLNQKKELPEEQFVKFEIQ